MNVAFEEPIHKILEKIKHKPYFCWPGKMGEDPTKRNQNLYCTYHRDKGHTAKQCRTFKDYLEQLVTAGHLREYVVGQGGSTMGQVLGSRGGAMPPPLGMIEVIHAMLIGVNTSQQRGILNITLLQEPKQWNAPRKSPGQAKRR